jgi:hypothetical protein
MKRLLLPLTSAAFVVISTSSQAELLLYEPFNYTAGERLGGAGTSPLGQVAPNGQQWITRSSASAGSYVEANDALITAGSLSYPGLSPSSGNSVRYGSSVDGTGLYTDAIALPSAVTDGSLYYSAIVRFNGPIAGNVRTPYASFSVDTADPLTDAGVGVGTASGLSGLPLPAAAWMRNSPTVVGEFQFGSGKQNGDGMGPSANVPSWQSSAAGHPYPNQKGNTAGTNQVYATIADNIYFIVLKYTFNTGDGGDDTVSMWINPVASTLGDDAGEAAAGAAGGSYYSAINANVFTFYDSSQIRSFMLLGLANAYALNNRSIDISLDELRIGTTWADVTPLPPPPPPQIISIAGAGTTSVTVTWTNALVGTNYVLQYNTNLSTTDWADLAPVTATGSTAFQTDNPPSGDAARFYRVLRQ